MPPRGCTKDAFQCPDGSWVSRDPATNCELSPCPKYVETQRPSKAYYSWPSKKSGDNDKDHVPAPRYE